MKKFLAVLMIIMLTHCSVSAATTTVSYSRSGAMVSVSRGAGMPRSVHNFGSNAPTVSARRGGYGHYISRQYRRPCQCDRTHRTMAMTREMRQNQFYGRSQNIASKTKTMTPTVSRLNKNYTIQPQKSYSRNSITYYN